MYSFHLHNSTARRLLVLPRTGTVRSKGRGLGHIALSLASEHINTVPASSEDNRPPHCDENLAKLVYGGEMLSDMGTDVSIKGSSLLLVLV